MEEKLIISEEKFRLFFEKSPYAIVNLNREGKLLKVNNEFLRITGYDMSDVENLYTFDMVFPEDIDRAKVRLNRVLKEGYVHEEIRIKSKNNKTLFINIEIIKISENEFIGFWKDVTQKKKMEEQIKVSEEKFRSYFDYSPNPITIFNKFGKILNSNKAAHKLSGYSHKEIISRSIFDVVSEKDADKAVEDFSRLLKEGKGITRLCIRRKDGTEMLIKMNVTRIKENEYLGFWEKLKDTD
jgi:PAS domain S-box-containing protein